MAESPLVRLARLLGGVALTHGRVPHQVLGQLLISDSSQVEWAGANTALAAMSGHRSALADAVVRTAAPAIAIQLLVRKQDARQRRLQSTLEASLQKLETTRDRTRTERRQLDLRIVRAEQVFEERTRDLDAKEVKLERLAAELDAKAVEHERSVVELAAKAGVLEQRERELETREREFEQREREFEQRERELEQRERELEQRERELAASPAQPEPPRVEPKPKPKPAKKTRAKKKPSGGPK